jgi:tetrahydromethanopterin S-methyltransferase subunit B
MKVIEKIIAEEGGEMLLKRVVELEEENSWLKATVTKLQGSVDSSTETITTL